MSRNWASYRYGLGRESEPTVDVQNRRFESVFILPDAALQETA